MCLFQLKTQRSFGVWLTRNFTTVMLLGCLGFILYEHTYVHVQRSFTVTDARNACGDRPTYQQINSTQETVIQKVLSANILTEIEKPNTYSSDGYKRAELLKKACADLQERPSRISPSVQVSYDIDHRALYCPLCKIASTFWARVFTMMERNKQGLFTRHPFEVPISEAKRSELQFDLLSQKILPEVDAHDSFRFLFVRDPYSHLFSAYVDKVVGPNPIFWRKFTQEKNPKDTCGDDLTFEQFLRNIIDKYKRKRVIDCHVATFDACQPCKMNYTFVAKMETFKTDTMHILLQLNQKETLGVFESNFSGLHAEDAIDDSVSGPYSWKEEITRCIPWYKALQRIWRKLQIRGVIGMDAFPLSNLVADGMTKENFIKVLQNTRHKTTSSERDWQKRQALKEAYRNVSNDILDEIKKIYKKDFLLFDYNDSPVDIFNKGVPLQYYGFMDYNTITKRIQQLD